MFCVLPVPVGPGFMTCLLFVMRRFKRLMLRVESDVGIMISW